MRKPEFRNGAFLQDLSIFIATNARIGEDEWCVVCVRSDDAGAGGIVEVSGAACSAARPILPKSRAAY